VNTYMTQGRGDCHGIEENYFETESELGLIRHNEEFVEKRNKFSLLTGYNPNLPKSKNKDYKLSWNDPIKGFWATNLRTIVSGTCFSGVNF